MKENEEIATIPFYVAESMLGRQAITIKRLWILCILLVILLVATNALWIWYESQFEYEQTIEQEVEADFENGNCSVIGIGDHYGNDSH